MSESHISSTKSRSTVQVANETQVLELESLFEISQLLSKSANLKAVLDNIMFTIMGRMMISKSAVLLADSDNKNFFLANSKGIKKTETKFSHENLADQDFLISDAKQSELMNYLSSNKLVLGIPLQNDDKTIGIFALGKKLSGESYTSNERSFLATLGRIAASFIQKNLTFEELKLSNNNLDKRVYQLTTLLEIGQKLNETIQFEEILKIFNRAVMGSFLINKMAVLFSDNFSAFNKVSGKGINCSPELISAAAEISEAKIITGENIFTRHSVSLVIPLRTENEIKGYVLCGPKMTNEEFSQTDLEFLDNVGNTLVSQLTNAQLVKERIKMERMEEELRLARKIQKDLLPSKNPDIEGIQIVGSNEPSRQVGGDYYDFIKVEDDLTGIAIGDVSGKGAAAAMLMSNLQASMQALTVNRSLPMTDCISRANSIIYKNTSAEKYITFFYCELNEKTNKLRYVNAGHNYPIIFRNGEIIQLKTGGLILGMMEGMPYEVGEIQLKQDDILVLYTDGITEAMNTEEEEFDEPRLIDTITNNAEKSAEEIHQQILDDVFEFSPNASDFDDITLIVLKLAK